MPADESGGVHHLLGTNSSWFPPESFEADKRHESYRATAWATECLAPLILSNPNGLSYRRITESGRSCAGRLPESSLESHPHGVYQKEQYQPQHSLLTDSVDAFNSRLFAISIRGKSIPRERR